MDIICPRMILRASSKKEGNVVELLPSPNTANLQRIVCNVHEPILLRLLLLEKETVDKILIIAFIQSTKIFRQLRKYAAIQKIDWRKYMYGKSK